MMIAEIAKRFTFDAAHYLDRLPPDHKCHRMHGHTYEVELVFKGEVNPATGFVLDYADIAAMWAPLHDRLDHRLLNEVKGLEIPSTENLARWIGVEILSSRHSAGKRLSEVRIKESSTTWCVVTRQWLDESMADDRLERMLKNLGSDGRSPPDFQARVLDAVTPGQGLASGKSSVRAVAARWVADLVDLVIEIVES